MEQPNLSYIDSMSRGDEAFVKKILDVIKKEFPVEKEIYYSNYKAKNFKLAAENVHKIKHKISILGLEKSYSIATDFENKLKENDDNLHLEFDKILQTITDYLETI